MRNIDIVKISKNHKPKKTKQIYRVPRQDKKSIRTKKLTIGLGFGLFNGIKTIFNSSIFMFSFLRNLFSYKPLFFIFIPLVYFELRYLLVLKPDQILSSIKSILTPQNTFQFVAYGLAIIVLLILSWLFDTFVVSALMRYNFQKIDHRKSTALRNINEALKNTGTMVLAKIQRKLVFIFCFIMFCLLIYCSFILGYGSLTNQITLYILSSIFIVIIYALYVKFRFTLQASSAIGLDSQKKKFTISLGQAFRHPVRSFLQSFLWILIFVIITLLCSYLAYSLINLLINSESVATNIGYLSIYSALIYILWSCWTAFSVGYWSSLENYEKHMTRLSFYADHDSDYFAFWILVIIILIALITYFAISFIFSSEISEFLVSIWNSLPDTVKINIPKPN